MAIRILRVTTSTKMKESVSSVSQSTPRLLSYLMTFLVTPILNPAYQARKNSNLTPRLIAEIRLRSC